MNEFATHPPAPRALPWGHGQARILPAGDDDGGPAPGDRRQAPRQPAVEHKAWLCWRSGAMVVADAVLLADISRGGACLIVADPPPAGEAVWLRLGPARATAEAAVARVAGVEPLAEKMWRVRLRFDGRCPAELLAAASSGHPAFVPGLN